MTALPPALQRLMETLERLPGIGPKSAARLTFFLLKQPELARTLAETLQGLDTVTLCQRCFHITEAGQPLCAICRDPNRDASTICVVEEPLDVLALERAGVYQGVYHVLHGVISPVEGVGPEDLRIPELLDRVTQGGVKEVILATNPSLEGDATASYLASLLKPLGVKVTRLAQGLPSGGDLEYADPLTLVRALVGRQEVT